MNPEAEPAAVVWAYRRTGKHAFHVLSGAMETQADLTDVPIEFANGVAAVTAAIGTFLAEGRRVLVGWSFYSPDAALMVGELQQVRGAVADERVLHVVGGVHASAEPEAMLRAGFDLVAIGEGEQTICELVAAWRGSRDVSVVAGTACLSDDRLVRKPRTTRLSLDEWPPVALRHERWGPIEITRGCIYACKFCQTPFFAGAAFRHRSVANVRHWVRELIHQRFRDFRFLTPTSLSYGSQGLEPDLAAVEELLAGVRADIGPQRRLFFGTFPSEVRPEHVSPAALQMLRRWVDNRTLILGGQSGSDRVLAGSARGHDVAAVERAVALCVEHGFVPHVDFLFGLPGEDPDDIEQTLRCMERLVEAGARVHGHTFLPLPGTPFRRAAAGVLTPVVRRHLQVLASRGAAYGQWEQQEVMAQDLARLRSTTSGD